MEVRVLIEADASSVVALWTEAGLTRPWNDPSEDYQRALNGAASVVLASIHRGGDAKCRIGQVSRDWNIFGGVLVDQLSGGRIVSPAR